MRKSSLHEPAAVERLRRAILRNRAFAPHLRKQEPDWRRFVTPLGLDAAAAGELIVQLKRLWLLPFAETDALADLLVFQHTQLPAIESRHTAKGSQRQRRLCGLFRFLVLMALQGNSIFPQNPVHLARQVQLALLSPVPRASKLDAFLDLLVDTDSGAARSGLNAAEAADPDLILHSEHERREGLSEGFWRTRHKFEAHRRSVRNHPEFQADWRALRRHFPVDKFRDSRGLLRRSRLPERNWQRPAHPDLDVTADRFQAAFDFFCWKWFLYGMRGDEPMIEKLTATLTPWGTQIFIPGYWSLDAARDVDWGKLLRLHRARGLDKQGPKLARNRRQRQTQLRRLRDANARARRLGLKGAARYQFLKQSAGLAPHTDDAQVRRMFKM